MTVEVVRRPATSHPHWLLAVPIPFSRSDDGHASSRKEVPALCQGAQGLDPPRTRSSVEAATSSSKGASRRDRSCQHGCQATISARSGRAVAQLPLSSRLLHTRCRAARAVPDSLASPATASSTDTHDRPRRPAESPILAPTRVCSAVVPSSSSHDRVPDQRSYAVDARSIPSAWHSFAGPSRVSRSPGRRSLARSHRLEPRQRRQRPEQHRTCRPRRAAHDVRAEVHAVGEVDVEMARRTEHRGVARRPARGTRGGRRRWSPGTPRPRRSARPPRPRARSRFSSSRRYLDESLARDRSTSRLRRRRSWCRQRQRAAARRSARRDRARSRTRRAAHATAADAAAAGRPAPDDGAPGSRSASAPSPSRGQPRRARRGGPPPLEASRTSLADEAVSLPKRHPVAHEPLREIDGHERRPVGCGAIRSMSKLRRADQPPERGSAGATWSSASNRGSLSSCRSRL